MNHDQRWMAAAVEAFFARIPYSWLATKNTVLRPPPVNAH